MFMLSMSTATPPCPQKRSLVIACSTHLNDSEPWESPQQQRPLSVSCEVTCTSRLQEECSNIVLVN